MNIDFIGTKCTGDSLITSYVIVFIFIVNNDEQTPKVGFYILVNFFLFFLNKSQKDPTFDFYNLAHSDVTAFHSFKPKVEKIFMNSNE